MHYQHKTKPYQHQTTAFERSRDLPEFALLMEMGTGKSKVIIDTAAWLYAKGEIDALFVIAPNGVHRNWVINEVPTHLPDHCHPVTAYWSASLKKKEQAQLDALWQPKRQGLRVLAMNVDAFATERGKTHAKRFLMAFRCLMAVDESSRIKTPKAVRTKALITLGKQARYRRILTGTPITQSPLDIYAQFKFLNEDLLGFSSYYAFRNRYAVLKRSMNRGAGVWYDEIVGYQNLEELKATIDQHGFRVTKNECLDLPAKVYERRYVELNKDQRELYEKLKKDFVAEFGTGQINAALALTRMLRLQQVTGGFAPVCDDLGEVVATHPVGDRNPKIDALLEVAEDCADKIIIWARFKKEITAITNALRKEYGNKAVVEYHGTVSNDDRVEAVDSFQSETGARFFVGQPHSGGIGLTLTAASTVVWYSLDFSLETYLQANDRAHRIGQTKSVTYIFIEAINTLDKKVIDTLQAKKNMADIVTGDPRSLFI